MTDVGTEESCRLQSSGSKPSAVWFSPGARSCRWKTWKSKDRHRQGTTEMRYVIKRHWRPDVSFKIKKVNTAQTHNCESVYLFIYNLMITGQKSKYSLLTLLIIQHEFLRNQETASISRWVSHDSAIPVSRLLGDFITLLLSGSQRSVGDPWRTSFWGLSRDIPLDSSERSLTAQARSQELPLSHWCCVYCAWGHWLVGKWTLAPRVLWIRPWLDPSMTGLPVPAREKHPQQKSQQWWCWTAPGSPRICIKLRPKYSIFLSSDQRMAGWKLLPFHYAGGGVLSSDISWETLQRQIVKKTPFCLFMTISESTHRWELPHGICDVPVGLQGPAHKGTGGKNWLPVLNLLRSLWTYVSTNDSEVHSDSIIISLFNIEKVVDCRSEPARLSESEVYNRICSRRLQEQDMWCLQKLCSA